VADENQKPAFSNNQYERLRRCSDAKNPSDWNDWVIENPPGWQALLEGADFRGATLSGVDFKYAILKDTKFDHATINEANFRSAQLNGASFVGATMKGATLNYADLSDSQLQGADLSVLEYESKVRRISNLEKTNMCRANLSNTNLSGAKLLGARLNGAELIKTDISGANLQFAVVDAGTVIDRCIFDEKTDFTAVGLDAAGIEPELKTAFKNNIRRTQWKTWFAKGNCAAKMLKNCFVRPFWAMTGYGSSTANIIYYFIIFACLFGSLYFFLEQTGRGIIDGLAVVGMPWYHTLLRGVYFSVVTMTTLGFGDLYAKAASYWGHVLLMAQVILGYVLLGALITRLGILFTGEAPAASPTSRKRKRRSR
jgi:uncharacterized protein YjbI with pentapeptide repeats